MKWIVIMIALALPSQSICQARCHDEVWEDYDDCGDLIVNPLVIEYSVSVTAYYRSIPLHPLKPKVTPNFIREEQSILANELYFDTVTIEIIPGDPVPNDGVINTVFDFPTALINIYQTKNVCFVVNVKTVSIVNGNFIRTCYNSKVICSLLG